MPKPKPIPALTVDLTPELRRSARELSNSMRGLAGENIRRTGAWGMISKFETVEDAGHAAVQLKAFSTATGGAAIRGVSENTGNEPLLVTDSLELFLPAIFVHAADELSATQLDSAPIPANLFALAEQFLAAYDHTPILYHHLDALPDDIESDWYFEAQNYVIQAHDVLLKFLRVLEKLKPDGPGHRVVIRRDLTIQVDAATPKLSRAQRRCLLALACLRYQESFTVVEFTELYSGKCGVKGLAGKRDFDNAFRVTKKLLPHLHHKAISGNRLVTGIKWHVMLDAEALRASLNLLHPVRG